MAKPPQFRDTPLIWFMSLAFVAIYSFAFFKMPEYQTIEIVVDQGCAPHDSCPAVSSLAALPSARDVRREVRNGKDIVSLRTDRLLSAHRVWTALETSPCRPLRMVVDSLEYRSKPLN